MAGKNVDTEALGKAASALGTYIANVQNSIQKILKKNKLIDEDLKGIEIDFGF